ncbi:MAG TPA: DNA-3-methyladenine glycosylase [Gemmatimonadaceae bacterium]|nr:DNA-3-methyladenine glycosylase [Gemmatimonadaceae bacterium]
MTKTTTAHTRTLVPSAIWQRTAVRHLKRVDPVLKGIIERVGPSRFVRAPSGSHLDALVRSIVSQQLSTSAAATIHGRLIALVGKVQPLPEDWLALNDPDMRTAGLSRQKIAYIRDLARHVHEGLIPMAKLHLMSDDEVIAALTEVKGIGVWTAQMFLMFRLNRPDILPVLDLGIRNAFRRAYKLRKEPTEKRMRAIAKPWAPYRSVASWYLWQSLELPIVELEKSRG